MKAKIYLYINIFLHKFIKIELIELKDLVTKLSPEEQTKIYKFYFKLILLYSSISLFNSIMMV